MLVTHLVLKNWRNFKAASADFEDVTYVLGANASGKSNLLDVFRFLRDIAKSNGGGLHKAVMSRGGLKKVRCLHARRPPEVGIEVTLSEQGGSGNLWKYELYFNSEGTGLQRPVIKKERVSRIGKDGNDTVLLNRPDANDSIDKELLTQTSLEQIQANKSFRELSDFFSKTSYVHLVPQLLKFADVIGGHRLEDDPFGQGFLERVAKTTDGIRRSRLGRIEKALKSVIPQVEQLQFLQDGITGLPHLEVRYRHHRPQGAIQREDQFSDGTLRLISLFWLILDGSSLLLLEEPELSLNEEIVAKLPALIDRAQRTMRNRRQILITTHSQALLSNTGIEGDQIVVLEPSDEGTTITKISSAEDEALKSGFSPAEAVLPRAQRTGAQLELSL